MAANLQIYSDAQCTTELTVDSGHYILQIGPTTGIDGTNGGSVTKQLWAKKTGDILISGVTLTETSDTPDRGSYSLDDATYSDTTITLGDMDPTDVVPFYIKVTVAAESDAGADIALNMSIAGTHL
jgi:hypothetical protein